MKFAPEYFEGEVREGFYVQPLMKRVWAAQIEVLIKIDKICTKHDIKYFAVYGTLLGAVRHKGFIPWDDDLDISMLRGDYERFSQIARKELPADWRLFDCNDDGFHTRLLRVVNSYGSRLDQEFLKKFHGCPFAIGVDIIPWDYIPDCKSEEKTMLRLMSTLDTLAVNWEEYEINDPNIVLTLQQLENVTGQHFDRSKPMASQLLHCSDMTAAMYWGKKTKYAAVAADLSSHPYSKVPVSFFDTIIRIPFENITVPVIENYELMLKNYYGEDYMQPQISYETHNYPFFINKLSKLKNFFQEQNATFPERFEIFTPKNGTPLISVIISCLHAQHSPDRCLQSLLCQTIGATNLEIICIDDHSSIHISNCLEEWKRKLGNILTIVSCNPNTCAAAARNIGIECAHAEYITFMDIADYVEMNFCERLYRPLQSEDYDIALCTLSPATPEDPIYHVNRQSEEDSQCLSVNSTEKRRIFLKLSPLGHEIWGKIIKRTILTQNHICFPAHSVDGSPGFTSLLYFYATKVFIQNESLYHSHIDNAFSSCSLNANADSNRLPEWLAAWHIWQERGFLTDYKDELEYEFLRFCYLPILENLASMKDQDTYSLFLLVKKETLAIIPDYTQNNYFEMGFSEMQKIILETLILPLGPAEFLQITDMIQKVYHQ